MEELTVVMNGGTHASESSDRPGQQDPSESSNPSHHATRAINVAANILTTAVAGPWPGRDLVRYQYE